MSTYKVDNHEANNNLDCFLDLIAWSEGTSISPATKCNGYDVIVTGSDGKHEIFDDFSDHPFATGRAAKIINSNGLKSTASGRYQFLIKDWKHYKNLLKLPDFSARSQDQWAIQLIYERRAKLIIQEGFIARAINYCSNIWASFPGGGYGQKCHPLNILIDKFSELGGKIKID